MDEQTGVETAKPRFEHGHFLLIAGLGGRFTAGYHQAASPISGRNSFPRLAKFPVKKTK